MQKAVRFQKLIVPALPGLLLPLLVCAVYSDPLLLRRNFAGRDLLAYNLPMEGAVHDAYARGRFPVWMPEVSGGRPLLPNPNSGALYPIRPLFALLPFPLAMRIFPVFHWALAGLGVLCLLRSVGASRCARWIGAVTYAFSGVAVSEVFFPHILPGLALLPWIIWAVARPTVPWTGKLMFLSVLFALEFLAGDVFSIGLGLACASLWILLEEARSRQPRELLLLAGSLFLAGLAAAPQILATALWVPETGRAVSGMKLEESLLFSISPFRLLEIAIPYPFGSTFALDTSQIWTWRVFHLKAAGLFATLFAGPFAIVGAVAVWRERVPGARFGRILALATLAVCVIPSLLPAAWGKMTSPLPLRNPEKFAVGFALALAILAGLAFDRCRRAPLPSRGMLLVAGTLCVLGVIGWLWTDSAGRVALRLVGESSGRERLAGEKLTIAFAEAGLLWIATLIALEALRVLPRYGLAISVVLLTFVPIAANRKIARSFPEDTVFSPTPFARFLRRIDPDGAYRAIGATGYRLPSALESANAANDPGQLEFPRRNWNDYTQALWRRGAVFNKDFDSGDFSRMRSLRALSQIAAGFMDAKAFFGSIALRWGIRFRDQQPLPGFHRVRGDALMDWDEHERAYPDIRLLTDWREEAGALSALKVLPLLKDGEIVIESGRRMLGTARPGRLWILEKSPERLHLQTEAPDPTWLFVLRGYWSHRTVLLDGQPAEDAPAQLAFSSVRLPAGRHTIEWRELMPGETLSRWGPVLFALAFAFLLLSKRAEKQLRKGA